MKNIYTLAGVAIMVCLLAATGMAETKFSYDGQLRLRSELDFKSFDALRHGKNFHDLRTRVGLKFEPTDRAFIYVQFQDSRRLGDPASGDLSASDNVDLHQAYFEIHNAIFETLYIRAGRFELNYGNQRVFGSVGWHNIGRSWEGGLLSVRPNNFRLDLFALKRMELNDDGYNRDFDIVGLYGMIAKAHLDLFAFLEYDADTTGYVQAKLKRFNLGGYLRNDYDYIDITVQGNYQLGNMPRGPLPDEQIQDIAAFMINGEVGYLFAGKGGVRLAAGIDYTSGDDGSDSSAYNAYTNAYYTGHAYRGYMDYFISSPTNGLMDIMLRGKGNVHPHWQIKGDVHYFTAAKDYVSLADDTTMTSNIGIEVDLTVVNKSINGATLTGGISVFVADKHFAPDGDDRKTGFWSYLMTTVNF